MELQKKSLNEMAAIIHANAVAKGFYDKPTNTAEKLMLIVSELGEACEADRNKWNAQSLSRLDKKNLAGQDDDMFVNLFS